MNTDDDILRDIELPEAMTPEERLRCIARLILKAIRIHIAKQSNTNSQPKPASDQRLDRQSAVLQTSMKP